MNNINQLSIIILQARTGSKRLKNKVLKTIQDITLLGHCIRRLKLIDKNVPVIIGTSYLKQDDIIADLSNEEDVDCFRGSEIDVLDRFYKIASKYNAKYILRGTADNPFVDYVEGNRVLREIQTEKWDYVSMVESKMSLLPKGVGIEAFTYDALENSWQNGHMPHHREHVNEYILDNLQNFDVKFLKCNLINSCPEINLSIDTYEDFSYIEKMLEEIARPALEITTEDIIDWWKNEKTSSYTS